MAKILEKHDPKTVLRHSAELGLDVKTLAAGLAVHPKTLQRWRDGTAQPNEAGSRFLEKLDALYQTAARLLKKDSRQLWFQAPNLTLGGERPIDWVRRGELGQVQTVLGMLEWGLYS